MHRARSTRSLLLQSMLFATAALSACGGSNNDTTFTVSTVGKLRVVNAISDSASIDLKAAPLPMAFSNVATATGSAFQQIQYGIFGTDVTVHTASGSAPTFTLKNVQVAGGQEVTVYCPGTVSSNSFSTDAFYVQNNVQPIGNGTLEVDVVHAASAAQGIVDVYVTAPTDALPTTPTYKATYRGTSGVRTLNAGSYRIRLALDSAPASVIFDSGTTGVTLASGQRLQIALLNETDSSKNAPVLVYLLPSDATASRTVHNGG